MIWLTWRQHRAEAGVAAALLAALATALIVIGVQARHFAQHLGLPGCTRSGADCGNALEQLHQHYHWLPPVTGSLIAVPLVAGMFVAAPLISREYEAGTQRLAWTQSITRRRWISIKLALILIITTGAALVLGLVTMWALDPLTAAFGTRFNSTWFDIQGIVPAVCMLFALSVGVTISALTRRTIPAIALTLTVYAAARIPVHFVRSHFWPSSTRTTVTPFSAILRAPDGSPQSTFGLHLSGNNWILKTTIIDPSGHTVPPGGINRDLLLQYCPQLPARGAVSRAAAHSCGPRLTGVVRDVVQYQPAGHFWIIQGVECVIFGALAAALVTIAILTVIRRRSI